MVNDIRNVWVEHRGLMSKVNVVLRPAQLEAAIHSLASSVDKSACAGSDKGIINAVTKSAVAAATNPTAIDRSGACPEIVGAIEFEDGIKTGR